MEFSKTKILIYVLTFLGFAWSGYGSDMIENLKDAVVVAEAFFGCFLKNAVSLIKGVGEAHRVLDASDDKCKFSCPFGGTPIKNKYHAPSFNGCGTNLLNLKINEYIPALDMTECCNQHDLCYDTCNNLKKDCDERFKDCLYKICDNTGKTQSLIKACKVAASMVGGSMVLGCDSYLQSQKRSCYCPSDDKKMKYTAGGEL